MRANRELSELQKNPIPNITVSTVQDNMCHWHAELCGPEGSPYEGGVFVVDIEIPFDYPLKAPKCKFLTQIYHPNVMPSSGEMCLEILGKSWEPKYKLRDVLNHIYSLVSAPNGDSPLATEIAEQYRTDKEAFDKTAREWTEKYAKGM